MLSSRNLYRPIKLIIAFNLFTLFLFVFGAWEYNIDNLGAVIAVVITSNIGLYFGYLLAGKAFQNSAEDYLIITDDDEIIDMLNSWTIIGAVIALPDMLYYSRMWTMSFKQIVERLIIGFTQSNLNYSLSLGYQDSGTIVERIVVLVDVLLYFFKFAVLPLSIILWKKISSKQKILCIYITVLDVIKWLLKGMNKGLFDIAIVFVTAMLIYYAILGDGTGLLNRLFSVGKKERKYVILIVAILIMMAAVLMFISNGKARTSESTTSYYSTSMGLSADRDNVLLRLIPSGLHGAALSLDMYLTNGYQGLSYALRLPFKWCYGIGNNQFLISNFRDVLGIDVSEMSYLHRIEMSFPWLEAHNWHSLYTWLANDVSFIFVPVVFFVYGFILCKAWIDSVEKHNPYAIIIVCFSFIRFAYTSANNQVMSSSFSFIAWYFALFMWVLSNKGIKVRFRKRIL